MTSRDFSLRRSRLTRSLHYVTHGTYVTQEPTGWFGGEPSVIGRAELKLKPLLTAARWTGDVQIKRDGVFDETGSLKALGSVRLQVCARAEGSAVRTSTHHPVLGSEHLPTLLLLRQPCGRRTQVRLRCGLEQSEPAPPAAPTAAPTATAAATAAAARRPVAPTAATSSAKVSSSAKAAATATEDDDDFEYANAIVSFEASRGRDEPSATARRPGRHQYLQPFPAPKSPPPFLSS